MLKRDTTCRWGDALCVVSATLFGVHKYRSEIVTAEVWRTAYNESIHLPWSLKFAGIMSLKSREVTAL